ncbi:MAG: alpha/beta hydrolase-fold protein [Candidatus Ventricola sp.]
MKKTLMISMMVFALLGAPALAEDPAQNAQPQAAMEQAAPGERTKDFSRGERPQGMEDGGIGGGRGGNMEQNEPDEALEAMLAEVQDAYQLLTFTDPETGFEMQYELFVPENCEADAQYPMIMFIPDSRAAGREPAFSLQIGWGGVVWATKEEQAKHPCFVLIPIFTETVVNDNFETSDQIDTAVRLIESLIKTYPIDPDRLYATGQSMGGMTSFHLNVKYPDLFAASLFVGSQWNNDILDALEGERFFYIVSAGDDKASAGQSGLMAVFDRDGAAYAHAEWSAQDDAGVQEAAVQAMLSEGCSANFVTFTKGTTVQGGASGSEHLTSFDYAYKLETVRDWLFAQSK